MARIILNDIDLRRHLEDMGEEHKALRDYVLGRLALYDEVRKLAESTVTRLAAAEHLCADIDIDALPGGVQDTIIEVGNTVHDVKEDWKYTMEDM